MCGCCLCPRGTHSKVPQTCRLLPQKSPRAPNIKTCSAQTKLVHDCRPVTIDIGEGESCWFLGVLGGGRRADGRKAEKGQAQKSSQQTLHQTWAWPSPPTSKDVPHRHRGAMEDTAPRPGTERAGQLPCKKPPQQAHHHPRAKACRGRISTKTPSRGGLHHPRAKASQR